MRWDETWYRLREWTNGQAPSERLAAQVLLAEGFTRMDPSHPLGGPDEGKDALLCRGCESWIMAVYFPRGQQSFADIKKKFVADFRGVRAHNARGMVFVINQELTLRERRQLKECVDGDTDVYHLERVVAVLDQPSMAQVRRQFLSIDEHPGGTGRGKQRRADMVALVERVTTPDGGFVGRERETEEVLAAITPPSTQTAEMEAVVVSMVAGMGGIGKTALARHCAAIANGRGWFPGGVYLVGMRGYDPQGQVWANAVFAPLFRWWGIPTETVGATADEQAVEYQAHLEQMAVRKQWTLLVFDNVATYDQVRGLLPGRGGHRVIVTTRDTLAVLNARRLSLDVLHTTAARQMLEQALSVQLPEDERIKLDSTGADNLTTTCGRLPLALNVVAGLLAAEPWLGLTELAAQLRAAGIAGFTDGERAVASVLDTSWRRLLGRDPETALLLRLLVLHPGTDMATETVAALADRPPADALTRLRVL